MRRSSTAGDVNDAKLSLLYFRESVPLAPHPLALATFELLNQIHAAMIEEDRGRQRGLLAAGYQLLAQTAVDHGDPATGWEATLLPRLRPQTFVMPRPDDTLPGLATELLEPGLKEAIQEAAERERKYLEGQRKKNAGGRK